MELMRNFDLEDEDDGMAADDESTHSGSDYTTGVKEDDREMDLTELTAEQGRLYRERLRRQLNRPSRMLRGKLSEE
ncbi:hypothetical protein CYMTET_7742 [Cymbomonas tetramitiformis]|uniref:Uncharacterized protein n=1 Tax=Cymbomonas tetramitiformis TaxID=36881 RepID=A0AAE0GWD1_9CHLO|nr:hypothetical protein CYMTET_7742 [Cymbomonas tetramitiformis]